MQLHQYHRDSKKALLDKLPREALHGLRYIETVYLSDDFTPLPPLPTNPKLNANSCYTFCITDHSLIILKFSSDANVDGSVLIELPWLGIKEIDHDEAHSSEFFEIPGRAHFNNFHVTIMPKLDMSKLPIKLLDTLKKKAEAVNHATEHTQLPVSDRYFGSSYFPRLSPSPVKQAQPPPRYTGRGHPNIPPSSKAVRSMNQGDHKDPRSESDPRVPSGEEFLFFKPEERYQANPWFKPPPSSSRPPPPSGWMLGPRALGEGVEDMSLEEQQNAWRLWQQQQLLLQQQQPGVRISLSSPVKSVPAPENKGLYCSGPEWRSSPISIEHQRSEAAMKPLSAEEKRKLAVRQQVHTSPNLLTWVEEQSIQWQKEQGRAGKQASFWLPNQRVVTQNELPHDAHYVVAHRPLPPNLQPPPAAGHIQRAPAPQPVPLISYSQPPNGVMPLDPSQPPPYIIQGQGYGQQPPSSYAYEAPPGRQHGDSYAFPYHEPDRKQRFEQEEALKTKFAIHRAKEGPINFSTFISPNYVSSELDRLPPPDQRQPLPPPVLQPKRDECWNNNDEDPVLLSAEDILEDEHTLPGYALRFYTVEPHSLIFHHIKRAWLGAHLRLGLTAAGKAGLPFWYLPPPSPFLVQSSQQAVKKACTELSKAIQKEGGIISIPSVRTWDRPLQKISLLSFFGHRIVLTPPSQQHLQTALGSLGAVGLMQLYPPSPPFPKLARWPDVSIPSIVVGDTPHVGEDGRTWFSLLEREQEKQLERQQRIYKLEPAVTKFHEGGILERTNTAPSSLPATLSAQVVMPKDLWRDWSFGALSLGCSLYDDDDLDLIQSIYSELAISGPKRAHELVSQFFMSPQVLAFVLHRLYAWGTICALYCVDNPFCSSSEDRVTGGEEEVKPKGHCSPYIDYVMNKGSRSDRVFLRPGEKRSTQAIDMSVIHEEVDMLTGKYQTHEEHLMEQFLSRTRERELSQMDKPPLPRPRDLLRKLGLLSDAPVSLPKTLSTIADTAKKVVALAIGSGDGEASGLVLGSRLPAVQAPPTLAPSDPLMLSPLSDLPYLFILTSPARALKSQSMSLPMKAKADLKGKDLEKHNEELRRQQAGLLCTSVGAKLKDDYVSSYLGAGNPQPHEISSYRPRAVKNWDRLIGRLSARLAWKKTQVLLSCLDAYLSFSEGATGREMWLCQGRFTRALSSEGLLMATYRNDPEAQTVNEWSWADCTRHLQLAILQLRDPDVKSTSAPPRATSKQQMLTWSEKGSRDYLRDIQSSLLYEIEGLCHQSDLLHSSQKSYADGHVFKLYNSTLRTLDVQFAATLSIKLMDRLLCLLSGTAALHGLPLPSAKPFAVSEILVPGSGPRVIKSQEAIVAVQSAACVGSAHTLISEVAAIHCSELLLHLLINCPGAATSIGDAYSEELHHLIRTPEAREMLRQRSCNVIVARATLDNLNHCLMLIRNNSEGEMRSRNTIQPPSSELASAKLSVPHLSKLQFSKMPGLMT